MEQPKTDPAVIAEEVLGLAHSAYAKGDIKLALEIYKHAVEIHGDLSEAHISLAILYDTHLQEYDKAAKHYREAIRLVPTNAVLRNNLGVLLHEHLGSDDEAMLQLREGVSVDGGNAAVQCNVAGLYEAARAYQHAVRHYRRALAIDPSHFLAHTNLALLMAREPLNMLDLALHHLQQALNINPHEFVAHFNMAVLQHMRMNMPEQAYRHYVHALTIDVGNADAHYYFAHLLLTHFSQGELARAHCKEALLLDSEHVEARVLMGVICEEVDGDFHGAAHYYQEAISLNSMECLGHAQMGRLYCRGGFAGLAVEHSARALLLQSHCLQAKNNIAAAFVHTAADQALNYLDRALQLCPQSPIVHFNLGMVYRKVADSRTLHPHDPHAEDVRRARLMLAYEHFSRAAELGHNDGEALACMAEIRMKLSPDDIIEVEKLYGSALNMSPSVVVITHGLALIMYSQGRFHEALELCAAAYQTQPDNPRPYRSLARILIEVFDRADEALPYVLAAYQIEPQHFETVVQLIMYYADRNLKTAQRWAQRLVHMHVTDQRAIEILDLVNHLIKLNRTETTI